VIWIRHCGREITGNTELDEEGGRDLRGRQRKKAGDEK
jgi:hypothetical protein